MRSPDGTDDWTGYDAWKATEPENVDDRRDHPAPIRDVYKPCPRCQMPTTTVYTLHGGSCPHCWWASDATVKGMKEAR